MTNQEFGVKMLSNDPDEWSVGGYLVVWGDERHRDLEGEFFTPDTNLGLDHYETRPIMYHHGIDGKVKSEAIGTIHTLKADKTGLWAQAQLDKRKKYAHAVRDLVRDGHLNWSSGTLPHLAEVDNNGQIKTWIIVEGSLTPTPAEPRNTDVMLLQQAYKALGINHSQELFVNDMKTVTKTAYWNEETQAGRGGLHSIPNNKGESDMALPASNEEIRYVDTGKPVGLMKSLLLELGLIDDNANEDQYNDAKDTFKAVITAKMEGAEVKLDDAEIKMDVNEVLLALGLPENATRDDAIAMIDQLFVEEETGMAMEDEETPGEGGKSIVIKFDHAKLAQARQQARERNARKSVNDDIPRAMGRGKSRNLTTLMRTGKRSEKPGVKSMLMDLLQGKSISYEQGPTGGYLLRHEVSDEIIPALRDKLPLTEMGVDMVPMEGIETMTLMKDNNEPEAYWVGEGTTIPPSDETVGGIMLVPKPLAVRIPIPNKFLTNSRIDYEGRIREKIEYAINRKMMISALRGAGAVTGTNTGAEPLGVVNFPSVTVTQLDTNGRKPTIDDLIDNCIGVIEDANVEEDDSMSWLFAPRTKRRFTAMKDNDGLPVLRENWGASEEKLLLGFPYYTSNAVERTLTVGSASDNSRIYFARWSSLAVGLSDQVEFMVDPYSQASQLQTQIIAHIYADIRSKYDEAFAVLTGVR